MTDVERVARALWQRDAVFNPPWDEARDDMKAGYIEFASIAMRETRLIDAEAAQALVDDGTFGPGAERDTAAGFVDWLKERADAED